MEKGEVVKAYKEYEQYLSALAASCRSVEDVHAPIAEGKWSVAEIVMHLAEWDRYIREQRLPGSQCTRQLPSRGPQLWSSCWY